MQATINTVENRFLSGVRWWGTSLRTICLHAYQYSCWNASDPNRPKLLQASKGDREYDIAMELAELAISSRLDDITNSADSYFDNRLPQTPVWARGLEPVFSLGHHRYFKTART